MGIKSIERKKRFVDVTVVRGSKVMKVVESVLCGRGGGGCNVRKFCYFYILRLGLVKRD
ncbi:uncharacterized protein G2W53_031453 [Senna tora]|uniref:Uncharacterized protein n=1 Tax=Senna tora TaxID=362788 RepID=A0A834THH3_9FABA|nr:uncharacterized protein G2W53_031453 [Senna tora]